MNLPIINKEDLIFSGNIEDDRTNTYLTLNDYDWMNYKLSTRFKTEKGVFDVKFEYYGSTLSIMTVEYQCNDICGEIVYEYSTDVFQRYMIRFLANHIAHWDDKYAFNGEDVVIDFYNEVLKKGKIVD